LRISAEVASKNRFRLIQFPFNLFEHQPVSEHNGNGNMISVAQQNNLITFSNRPLNCHTSQGFIRLACYEAITEDEVIAAEAAHKNFIELITKKLRVFGVESDPFEFEIIAHLDKHWKTIGNHSAVDKLFAEYLRPFLNNFYNDSIPEKDFISSNMATTERNVILKFYEACKKFSTQIMSQRCSEAIETLKNSGRFPSEDTRSLPVIACDQYLKNRIDHVLAGMTKEKYVEEMRGLF
jgi:hypothetical protein